MGSVFGQWPVTGSGRAPLGQAEGGRGGSLAHVARIGKAFRWLMDEDDADWPVGGAAFRKVVTGSAFVPERH